MIHFGTIWAYFQGRAASFREGKCETDVIYDLPGNILSFLPAKKKHVYHSLRYTTLVLAHPKKTTPEKLTVFFHHLYPWGGKTSLSKTQKELFIVPAYMAGNHEDDHTKLLRILFTPPTLKNLWIEVAAQNTPCEPGVKGGRFSCLQHTHTHTHTHPKKRMFTLKILQRRISWLLSYSSQK